MSPSAASNAHDDSPSDVDHDSAITPQKPSSTLATPVPTPGSPPNASTHSSSSSASPSHHRTSDLIQQSSEDAALKKTGWLLLRSTARNLSSVLQYIGASNLHVMQLFDNVRPPRTRPLAFMLLYKWAPDRGDRVLWNPERMRNFDASLGIPSGAYEEHSDNARRDVLFVGQTMDNAAATQALILAMVNLRGAPSSWPLKEHRDPPQETQNESLDYDVGESIKALRKFLEPLDPVLRAAAVSSSAAVREAHNRAAQEQIGGHPELLDEDGKVRTSLLAEELWMYSVYVPSYKGEYVYEMRGMSDGAYLIDVVDEEDPEDWINVVFSSIDEHVKTFRQHNIPFLLFALAQGDSNQNGSALRQHGRPCMFNQDSSAMHHGSDGEERENEGDRNDDYENDAERDVPDEIVNEEKERIAATHNYDTFFIEMLKLMASKGEINSLIRGVPEPSSHDHMEE